MAFVKVSWLGRDPPEMTYPEAMRTSYYGMINWWSRGEISKEYGKWANDMTGVEVRGMQPTRLSTINASHRYYEVYDANRTEPLRHHVAARVDTTQGGPDCDPSSDPWNISCQTQFSPTDKNLWIPYRKPVYGGGFKYAYGEGRKRPPNYYGDISLIFESIHGWGYEAPEGEYTQQCGKAVDLTLSHTFGFIVWVLTAVLLLFFCLPWPHRIVNRVSKRVIGPKLVAYTLQYAVAMEKKRVSELGKTLKQKVFASTRNLPCPVSICLSSASTPIQLELFAPLFKGEAKKRGTHVFLESREIYTQILRKVCADPGPQAPCGSPDCENFCCCKSVPGKDWAGV